MTPKNLRAVKTLTQPFAAQVVTLTQHAIDRDRAIIALAQSVERLEALTFVDRWRWMLLGTLPPLPASSSVPVSAADETARHG